MLFAITSLILFSLFLTALVLVTRNISKVLTVQMQENTKQNEQAQSTAAHLANLLASKDPLAFQQISTIAPIKDSEYTGPIVPGDELEQLEAEAAQQDQLWKMVMADLEEDNGD